jgi:hypothetical protein
VLIAIVLIAIVLIAIVLIAIVLFAIVLTAIPHSGRVIWWFIPLIVKFNILTVMVML